MAIFISYYTDLADFNYLTLQNETEHDSFHSKSVRDIWIF